MINYDEKYRGFELFICSTFGCGRVLSRKEYLSGDTCIHHRGNQTTIKTYYEAINRYRKIKDGQTMEESSTNVGRVFGEGSEDTQDCGDH